MSYHKIIDLISKCEYSKGLSEIGFIKWNHNECEQPFSEGINIIESKSKNGVLFKAYMVCVRNDPLLRDDDDSTDAEEELSMTPMISFKTNIYSNIPESDDGEDSNDSVDSIILPSQETKNKLLIQKCNTTKESSNDETIREEPKSEVVLQPPAKPVGITDAASKSDENPVQVTRNIHEEETQTILPQLVKETSEGDDDSDIRDSQLCDFNEFTEDFGISDSQSLLLDVESAYSSLPCPILNPISAPVIALPKPEKKISFGNNVHSELESEITDMEDDEPTQILNSVELPKLNSSTNKSFDIHEAQTQLLPVVSKTSDQNESSPDIYNMATQYIVKDENVVCKTNNIYDALTQCVVKENEGSDDSTDIEDDIPSVLARTGQKKNSNVADNDVVDDVNDENMTQVVEEPLAVKPEPGDIYEQLTQVIEVPNHNNSLNILCCETQDVNSISHNANDTTVNIDDEDVYNLPTQVIQIDHKNNFFVSPNQIETITDVGASNIFNMETQIVPNAKSNGDDISPISKTVYLSPANLSGEVSIDSHKSYQTCATNKELERAESADKFFFSTPHSTLKKRKKARQNVSLQEGDITTALKNVVPCEKSDVDISHENYYENTQDLAADLMATDIAHDSCISLKKPEKDSPGKENSCTNQAKDVESYQCTQEVLNDLCTQQQVSFKKSLVDKDKINVDNVYKNTQDVLSDLLTQNAVEKPMKNTIPVFHIGQPPESNEEIFKSPSKRKIRYMISDSELDSPQIELFASKMVKQKEDNVSDSEEAHEDNSEDVPVVFRVAVPTKKSRLEKTKENLKDRLEVPPRRTVQKRNISEEECSRPKRSPANEEIPGPSKINDHDSKFHKVTDSYSKPDLNNKIDSKEKIMNSTTKRDNKDTDDKDKRLPRRGRSSQNIEDISDNYSKSKSYSKTRRGNTSSHNKTDISQDKADALESAKVNLRKRKSSTNTEVDEDSERSQNHDNITRRSTRVRKANRKYGGDDIELNTQVLEDVGIFNVDKKTNKNNSARGKCATERSVSKNSSASVREESRSNKPANANKKKSADKFPNQCHTISSSRESKAKDKRHRVMLTSLDVQSNSLGQAVVSLGGSVVEKDGDILVAPIPCKRTIKVMISAAKGIPIVSPQWITVSQKAGRFVNPWDHILKCDQLETKYNILLKRVLETARPYLEGWVVCVTPKLPIPYEQLKDLVEACGGVIELVSSTASRRSKITHGKTGTFSVSCSEDSQLWSIIPEPIVSLELLLQGSFTHTINFNQFKIKRH